MVISSKHPFERVHLKVYVPASAVKIALGFVRLEKVSVLPQAPEFELIIDQVPPTAVPG